MSTDTNSTNEEHDKRLMSDFYLKIASIVMPYIDDVTTISQYLMEGDERKKIHALLKQAPWLVGAIDGFEKVAEDLMKAQLLMSKTKVTYIEFQIIHKVLVTRIKKQLEEMSPEDKGKEVESNAIFLESLKDPLLNKNRSYYFNIRQMASRYKWNEKFLSTKSKSSLPGAKRPIDASGTGSGQGPSSSGMTRDVNVKRTPKDGTTPQSSTFEEVEKKSSEKGKKHDDKNDSLERKKTDDVEVMEKEEIEIQKRARIDDDSKKELDRIFRRVCKIYEEIRETTDMQKLSLLCAVGKRFDAMTTWNPDITTQQTWQDGSKRIQRFADFVEEVDTIDPTFRETAHGDLSGGPALKRNLLMEGTGLLSFPPSELSETAMCDKLQKIAKSFAEEHSKK